MKKIVLSLIVILFAITTSFAGTPPSDVQKAFDKMYPGASKISWDQEKPSVWEAEFVSDGYKMEAKFSDKGMWIQTESDVKVSNLPAAIKETIKTKYTGWEAEEANKVESAKEGSMFEVTLKMGVDKKSLSFKEDGTQISK
jgi:hypothetical protein